MVHTVTGLVKEEASKPTEEPVKEPVQEEKHEEIAKVVTEEEELQSLREAREREIQDLMEEEEREREEMERLQQLKEELDTVDDSVLEDEETMILKMMMKDAAIDAAAEATKRSDDDSIQSSRLEELDKLEQLRQMEIEKLLEEEELERLEMENLLKQKDQQNEEPKSEDPTEVEVTHVDTPPAKETLTEAPKEAPQETTKETSDPLPTKSEVSEYIPPPSKVRAAFQQAEQQQQQPQPTFKKPLLSRHDSITTSSGTLSCTRFKPSPLIRERCFYCNQLSSKHSKEALTATHSPQPTRTHAPQVQYVFVMSTVDSSRRSRSVASASSTTTKELAAAPSSLSKRGTASDKTLTSKVALLRWCQDRLDLYNVTVENFTTSWKDGLAFCGLLHSQRPNLFDFRSLKATDAEQNLEKAFEIAEKEFGIDRFLDVSDVVGLCDEKSIMTYISEFQLCFSGLKPERYKPQPSSVAPKYPVNTVKQLDNSARYVPPAVATPVLPSCKFCGLQFDIPDARFCINCGQKNVVVTL